MKQTQLLIVVLLFTISCSDRKEFKAEDYKQKQIEYEKAKSEITKNRGRFFNENKEKLMDLAKIYASITDSSNNFEKAPTDSMFFKDDVVMQPVNKMLFFGTKKRSPVGLPKVQVVFIERADDKIFRHNSFQHINKLIECYNQKNEQPCKTIKEEDLKTILDIKYAFIIDEYLKMEPKLTGRSEFDSGIFLGKITCYDIKNDKPILSFVLAAQNSDEIEYYGSLGDMKLKQDLENNIRNEISNVCTNHFLFEN